MKLVNTYILFISLLILGMNPVSTQAQVWSLEQCVDSAQVHNKSLQIGKNNLTIGEEKNKEAIASLMPKVTANADYKYFFNLPYQLMPLSVFNGPEGQFKEAQFGVPHNINANLQLTMPLYNPQIYGAIEATSIATELKQLEYKKTEEQIFFEISNLYYNAQVLHHQLNIIEGNLKNAQKFLANIQLLNNQQMATGTDVSKMKLQVTTLNTQKDNISNKYQQVLNALKFTIGISIDQDMQIDHDIRFHDEVKYDHQSILDIQLVKTRHRLLSSELNTLKRSALPTLALFGTYGTTGFGYDQKPNEFLKFYPMGFAGVQLSYPLFDGSTRYRKINQKKLELNNSDLQLAILSDQNNMQVVNAKLQRSTAQNSVEMTQEEINLAQKIYDQTILQQEQGTANLNDVLMAENALRESQQKNISAIVDFLKAELELKKLTGNLK